MAECVSLNNYTVIMIQISKIKRGSVSDFKYFKDIFICKVHIINIIMPRKDWEVAERTI